MSVTLPPPLDLYFASENTDDTVALARCFAPDAVVSDEAQSHRGLAEIAAWKTAGKRKTGYMLDVLAAATDGGRSTVKAKVTGRFPGSPATLTYVFTVRDGLIQTLEIG